MCVPGRISSNPGIPMLTVMAIPNLETHSTLRGRQDPILLRAWRPGCGKLMRQCYLLGYLVAVVLFIAGWGHGCLTPVKSAEAVRGVWKTGHAVASFVS
jgi:hypothetical protein